MASLSAELGDVDVEIGRASHPVTTGIIPFRNLDAPMPSAPITSGNTRAAATRVGCGAFVSCDVVCVELRAKGSGSGSACPGSINESGTGIGSGGITVGVYMITVPRMNEESSVERRVNLVESVLWREEVSECGDGDVASGNCEGVVRSTS